MSEKHRTITQRLERAKLPESKAKVLFEWATSWQAQDMGIISQLEKAVSKRDFDAQCIALGHLKEDLLKRFDVLPKILLKALEFAPEAKREDREE